jgi:lipopolysaccharide/colanic/teichoic acid biosynthesis glycosyltransferase
MIMKRLFDLAVSVLGLLLLLPVFLIVAALIKTDSPGPVFFRQERIGRGGRAFRIHKFRTMQVNHGGPELTGAADSRITRVGDTLRRYRIDELPQLIDVVFGDMSLVGPRPEVRRYMDRYSEADRAKILSVRPGMTDWTSIRFRNESELLRGARDPEIAYVTEIMPIKARMYREYVDHRTFWGDMAILVATFLAIVSRK